MEVVAAIGQQVEFELCVPEGPVNAPAIYEGFRRTCRLKNSTVVDQLPKDKRAARSRWVLSSKVDKDGQIVKTEATHVAQGSMHVHFADSFETSALIRPAAASMKIVMPVANQLDFKVFHFDVSQAFVRPDPDCEVFTKLPDGCGGLSGKIVSLQKASYGLRQSLLRNACLVKNVVKHRVEQGNTGPWLLRLVRGQVRHDYGCPCRRHCSSWFR